MKKSVYALLVLVLLVISLSVVMAQTEQVDDIKAAFECVDNRVAGAESLTFEEAAFAALARVPETKIQNTINNMKSSGGDCWPGSGCRVRDSGIALLAQDALGKDTSDISQWLKDQVGTSSELAWYLQVTIENDFAAECTVFHDGSESSFKVNDALELTDVESSCLGTTQNGYWLAISDSCLEDTFKVSCNESFFTNLLYVKDTGGTVYVSAQTNGASGGGFTEEKVAAKCFMENGQCNYEGSLWASAALYAVGEETDEFIPYLLAMSADNLRFFPSAFLGYIIGGSAGSDHRLSVAQQQKPGGFWDIDGSPYSRSYDTALGMLSLGGHSAPEIQSTITFLMETQTEEGCWNNNNIRDSAFLLYSSGWLRSGDDRVVDDDDDPKMGECSDNGEECTEDDLSKCEVPENASCIFDSGTEPDKGKCSDNGEECTEDDLSKCEVPENASCIFYSGGTGTGPIFDPNIVVDCEQEGYSCAPDAVSCLEAGGTILEESKYACVFFTDRCCTEKVERDALLESCFTLGGSACSADQECSATEVNSLDGACCLATCEFKDDDKDDNGGGGTDPGGEEPEDRSIWWVIVILLILILLVVLGIIYRDKIRLWWYTMRGKAKTRGVSGPRGGLPPPTRMGGPPPGRMMPRGIQRIIPGTGRPMPASRPPTRAPARRPASKKEQEFEDTMKKLKKMSE